MRMSSPAFKDGATIPAKHTGDSEDVSPPLEWAEVPEGTTEFALDETVSLSLGANKQALLDRMDGHILAKASVIGTYGRSA